MTDDIKLPALPRLQVPRIEADVSLIDIKVLARWCERIATDHARAAVLADRASRSERLAEAFETPERIWIESDGECPYFYHEEELSDVAPPITEYVRADK